MIATPEINLNILSVLLLSITMFFVMEYWFARQEAERYKQLYYDMWKWTWKWTSVMPENELKEKLSQREEEDDGWHSNNRRNVYDHTHGVGSVYPDGHIEYPDGTIKRKKEEGD